MSYVAQFFQTWRAMSSTEALLGTLAVIIWYIYETKKLRKATEAQTEAILSPSNKVEPHRTIHGIDFINVGNSPALNITIEHIDVRSASDDLLFKVIFHTEYLLEPGKHISPGIEVEFYDEDMRAMTSAFSL